MNKISAEQIKELRFLTQAGMAACKDALVEAEGDMNKAVDIVKAKGLQNVTARSGRVGSEGRVAMNITSNKVTLVEVNCQTDFVANSPGFGDFVEQVSASLGSIDLFKFDGDFSKVSLGKRTLEDFRKETCVATGENVVIRRWMVEEINPLSISEDVAAIATYIHSNNKLGVAVSFECNKPKIFELPSVKEFMSNVAMQIAAMNPIAVSTDRLPVEEVTRQRAIFETQLREANKPEASWKKIITGKFNKWYSDVVLYNQESVVSPKLSVDFVLGEICKQLDCELKILNFVRLQVGEGIEVAKADLAAEVEKLSGVARTDSAFAPGSRDVIKGEAN